MKTISLDEVLKNKLDDKKFSILYEKEEIKNKVARMVIQLRQREGLTQEEMARRANTSQPVIARLERGTDQRIPSLELLNKIAHSLGRELEISFKEVK
jgi:DNA-binding XRE family transcriptional regulator